ncbi:regulator of G-protein signaling 22 isoform X2 [Amia ocellicauda]|uniref:regulator of G-protein signaling 22 isoform X2 n=1 Tax=Amia ocellicauda TaxID=2972642 RepID=UPI0034645A7A
MLVKQLTVEPPDISNNNFEDYLVRDDLLAHYFNEFLSLPTFSEAITFNKDTGVFEVVTNAADLLSNQIKALLATYKSKISTCDVKRRECDSMPAEPLPSINIIDNTYNVTCLDREQGVQWIRKERVPLFLHSDCYFEYRLAKLLSQIDENSLDLKLQIDPAFHPWSVTREPSTPALLEDDNETIMRTFCVSLGQASVLENKEWFTLARKSQTLISTQSLRTPLCASEGMDRLWIPRQETGGSTSASSSFGIASAEELSISLDGEHLRVPHFSPRRKGALAHTSSYKSLKSLDDSCFACIPDSPSQTPSTVLLDMSCESGIECDREDLEAWEKEEASLTEACASDAESPSKPGSPALEDFVSYLVDRVLKNTVSELCGDPLRENEGAAFDVNSLDEPAVTDKATEDLPAREGLQEDQTKEPSAPEQNRLEEESVVSDSDEEAVEEDDNGLHGNVFSTSHGLERFKNFLQGTLGEKQFSLWMDIERLKNIEDPVRKDRHLQNMKSRYLLSSGHSRLNAELLSRLTLSQAFCWTELHLRKIQLRVTEPLLLYWGPRFCLALMAATEKGMAQLKMWRERQLRPPSNIDPSPRTITLLPLRPKSCVPNVCLAPQLMLVNCVVSSLKTRPTVLLGHTQPQKSLLGPILRKTTATPRRRPRPLSAGSSSSSITDRSYSHSFGWKAGPSSAEPCCHSSSSPVLGGRKMERLLQALHHEPRTGYCFTRFCELSGNKLWKNGVYFWFELQDYHRLFFQEGLNSYKLHRQAQLLYSTYVCHGAPLDTGVDLGSRRQIYDQLTPAFEELFDPAEEHVLSLLLEPWTQMTACERAAYEKVKLEEETRHLDSVHYRKLKALHKKMLQRLKKDVPEHKPPAPPAEVPREPELWAQVPEEFRGYSLGSLLHQRLELEHFRSFLEEHFASMDLMCWLDIEQFRRMLHKDREKREEKSKDIKSMYLNKKYFFGPNSPATREQQEEVMQLGGGWGRILHERLSAPVLIEVQRHVRRRIERKWLPLFLASPQFAERQRMQAQMKDVAEDQAFSRHRKKREVWKYIDSKWVTSSKEVLAFRKALLNPVTCRQFQRFVSLKGDFLENGVLFWLEVQRYKDLCHSHCDEATIQSKVTTIINCFINSTIPPALQIDIPPEQAHAILERRRELGPYVFREAQMTVFGVLFKLWPEFCSFRSGLEEEKILPVLQRKREQQQEKFQRRIREEDRRAKEQEEAKKKSSFAADFFGDYESVYSGSQEGGVPGRENGGPAYQSQQISWSYSKYLEALEQEEMKLHHHNEQDLRDTTHSLSSDPDTSSLHSSKSNATKRTLRSIPSLRAENIPH